MGQPPVKTVRTFVPKERPEGRVEELPFSPEECAGCPRYGVCENGSNSLPLVVRAALPVPEYRCERFGMTFQMCEAVSVKGAPRESEPLRKEQPKPLYLLDANIFLNAYDDFHELREPCRWVLDYSGIRIGTTAQVIDRELFDTHGYELPVRLKIIDVPRLEPWVLELRPAEGMKELSPVDRTLIQAAADTPDCRGIVTFDPDFMNCAVAGILSKRTGRKIEVVNAYEVRAGRQ